MSFQDKLNEYLTQEYVIFENSIDLSLIEDINENINLMRKTNGPGSFHIVDGRIGNLIDPLLNSEGFKKVDAICRKITLHLCKDKYVFNEDTADHRVIRCADHRSADIANGRHYDSYLQTLLIPLQLAIPHESNGDLLLYKKSRNTQSSLVNAVEKVIAKYTGESAIQREYKSFRDIKSGACRRIDCKVGNVYFFNGFRTKHCNLSVSSGERRSLLLHSYNPHMDMGIGKILRAARRLSSIKDSYG